MHIYYYYTFNITDALALCNGIEKGNALTLVYNLRGKIITGSSSNRLIKFLLEYLLQF